MIKFWPEKETHGITAVAEIDGASVTVSLDLEQAYAALEDFSSAITIVESDFVDTMYNGVGE